MTQEKMKLPRSSYEEICKIIKAYGRLNQPESLDQVSVLSGIGKTNISANNSFLASIGLIQGGKSKEATKIGKELAQALEHDLTEEIKTKWGEVVENNDFLNKMALAVKIRKSMDVSSLESHIAYSAGETKSKQVMTGARAVIDILRFSGVVREEDDKIIPGTTNSNQINDQVPIETANNETSQSSVSQIVPLKGISSSVSSAVGSINLNIELKIDVKPSELDGLGEKLKALFKSLSESEKQEKTD